jgi:hypothetical protein
MFKLFALVFVALTALLVSPSIQASWKYDEIQMIQNTLSVKIANNGTFTKFLLSTSLSEDDDDDAGEKSSYSWVSIAFTPFQSMVSSS